MSHILLQAAPTETLRKMGGSDGRGNKNKQTITTANAWKKG